MIFSAIPRKKFNAARSCRVSITMSPRKIIASVLALAFAGTISTALADGQSNLPQPNGPRPLNNFSGFIGGVYPYYGHPYHYVYDGVRGYYLTDIPDEYLQPTLYEGRVVPNYSDRRTVTRVQRQLAARGYYRGQIDGIDGQRTRAAVQAYEKSHGLIADGRIDPALLARMGLS